MSAEWGLLPAGIDETDLVMILLALFILSLVVIALFIIFHWFLAILGTLVIILSILYGVRQLKQKEDSDVE
jgi:1,4-dihydroxy-2-naphthoate octaprenyltransferase